MRSSLAKSTLIEIVSLVKHFNPNSTGRRYELRVGDG